MTTAARRRTTTRQWLLWFGALGTAALLLLSVRDRLDHAHVALVLLLVVLGGSAAGGRAIGIALALAAFLVFDLAFLRPYNTVLVDDPADWIVLVAFLVTGVVAAELLERQRNEAETARRRTEEIDRLAAVGAEALNAPHPEEALRAIADVIRLSTQTDRCEISSAGGQTEATENVAGAPLPSRDLRRVLRVRDRVVGTLHLNADRPFLLSAEQERVLGALSYYAALGLERVRLAGSEDEAAALRRADRVKDALLASVSHDLRTPLTAIKGIANEIARGEDPTRAHLIEEEADRLNALVADLLDLSQLTAGEMRLDPAVNTADDVVGSALQRVEPVYPERSFQATLAEPWVDLVGRFDFVQTLRILTNLLENAAKYAPARTPVHLRVWRESDRLRFAVEDEGVGLEPSDRERAFEPFVRGSARPAGTRGTGLGLSIARRLAEAQGGRLDYEPTDDVRSRFVLTLPATDVRAGTLDGSL
jgi:two-component system sensor histidine kinase KdpD